MIPVFFIIFVIFIIIFNYVQRKSTGRQEEVEEQFWKREREANLTRKQDISQLPYIYLPRTLISGNLRSEAEEKLLALDGRPMIDLTEYTNTELKLKYGAANLNILNQYETDYIQMYEQLPIYIQELIDASKSEEASMLFQFAEDHQITSNALSDAKKMFQKSSTR